MNYAEFAKSKGIRLELSVHDNRCWRKFFDKKMYYFSQPVTKEGYAAALEEWYLQKAKLAGKRRYADVYIKHKTLFNQALAYYDQFGTPASEQQLRREIKGFVDLIDEQFKEPQLSSRVPDVYLYCRKYKHFGQEFCPGPYMALGVSTINYLTSG